MRGQVITRRVLKVDGRELKVVSSQANINELRKFETFVINTVKQEKENRVEYEMRNFFLSSHDASYLDK